MTPTLVTDPTQLKWFKGIGSQLCTYLDPPAHLVKITQFPRGIGVTFLLERFSDRVTYKVTDSAYYPTLEAAMEGAQS